MDKKNRNEEIAESIRQEIWYWLQDNPTPMTTLAEQMRLDRATIKKFIFGENKPDLKTLMRVKQFLKEKYDERDGKIKKDSQI